MYVVDGRENYWADQNETSTTYFLQPRDGSAEKNFEKIQQGARGGPFLLKNAFFSNILIIYDPIEPKL